MKKSNDNSFPVKNAKQEIKIKNCAKAEALKKVPDELIARAIHDAIIKDHEKR